MMMKIQLALFPLLSLPLSAQTPEISDAQCTTILNGALKAYNPDTRKQAVVALSLASENGSLLPLLINMVDDKDVPVRVAVAGSLSEINAKPALDALHKLLQDPVPEVSFAAAKALWNLHDPGGRQALLSVVEGESKTASGYITSEMRTALRMMHTPTTTLLYAAREGVGFVPVPGLGQGIASMQALLTDPGISGRATAVLLLGKDKDPALIPALKDALSDKNWTVRAAAVHSLALRNDPAMKKDIAPMLQDDKEGVRLRAAAAFLRLSAIQARAARKPVAKSTKAAGSKQTTPKQTTKQPASNQPAPVPSTGPGR
jgi:HEAT repeat protein